MDYLLKPSAQYCNPHNKRRQDLGPSLSLEVGQRHGDKVNRQGWYLEPQPQLSLGRQSVESFTASSGLAVKVDDSRRPGQLGK